MSLESRSLPGPDAVIKLHIHGQMAHGNKRKCRKYGHQTRESTTLAWPSCGSGCVDCTVFMQTSSLLKTYLNQVNVVLESMTGWPSGLRRQIKALVSSEAWVRIPLQSIVFSSCYSLFMFWQRNNKGFEGMLGYSFCCSPWSSSCSRSLSSFASLAWSTSIESVDSSNLRFIPRFEPFRFRI